MTINELKTIETEDFIIGLSKIAEENRKLRKEVERLRMVNKYTDNIMKEHIDFLNFPTRIRNALMTKNIDTIEKLCNETYEDASKLRGMGKTSFEELLRIMEEYDLHFKEDEE